MSETNTDIITIAITASRRRRAAGLSEVNDAIYLAKDTETALGNIAEKYGAESLPMTEAATAVAAEMLNVVITAINRRSKDRQHDLSDARKALTYISRLPVNDSFAETRLKPQRNLIIDMLRNHGIPDKDADINFSPTIGDDTCFSSCITASDFSLYLRRHPQGIHAGEANRAIKDIEAKRKHRQTIIKMCLQVCGVILAIMLLVTVCMILGVSTGITTGLSILMAGIAAAVIFIRSFGVEYTSVKMKRYISGGTALVFLFVGTTTIATTERRQQRAQLNEILAHGDEDALMDYLCNPHNTYYADEAFSAYLTMMDSVFFDPERMAKPSQLPPLARMANLAKSGVLPESKRKILENRVKLRTDSLYHLSLEIDDLDSWLSFQALAPSDLYYDSSEHIDSIETLYWSSEPTAWASATRQGTREGYTRYIDLFPDGEHSAHAKARLIDLEVNNYRNQGQVTVESISRIADYSGPGSRVCIYNNSDYDVKFMFSGPASVSYTVGAHCYDEHDFTDGTYQVLALISNPQRDRFSFPQNLSRGIYSSTIEINDKLSSPE